MRWSSLLVSLVLLSPLAVGTARASHDDGNFRSDVLHCEEALGKLADCCPRFVTTDVSCTYDRRESTSGCDFTTIVVVTPAFTLDESRCILASTCQVLNDTGVCGRAQKAVDYVTASRDSPDAPEPYRPSSSHGPVCP